MGMKVKTMGLVLRPGSPELRESVKTIRGLCREYGMKLLIESDSAKMVDMMGVDLNYLCQESEVIMALGGDGTFLGAIRKTLAYQKPVIGVHVGRLGFLAEASFDDIEKIVSSLSDGKYLLKERMIIRAEVVHEDKCRAENAVNEIVIRGKRPTSFVDLKLYVDGKYVNSYLGDGLIVATPTGSTAYNLSALGPIVYPFSENFIFTPICSHSLSQRSLILPVEINDIEIRFGIKDGLLAVIDGQKSINLDSSTCIKIKKRDRGIKVVCLGEMDFFKALKSKLNWGDNR